VNLWKIIRSITLFPPSSFLQFYFFLIWLLFTFLYQYLKPFFLLFFISFFCRFPPNFIGDLKYFLSISISVFFSLPITLSLIWLYSLSPLSDSILYFCRFRFFFSVQQETFQAWTVYRRYSSFVSLAEQLQILHPLIPDVPKFNPDNLSIDNLDQCRSAMDNW
jgi:hypothetical protein